MGVVDSVFGVCFE